MLDFAIPPFNGQTAYQFTPTTGSLAQQPVTLVLHHDQQTYSKQQYDILELYVQKGTGQPVLVTTLSLMPNATKFSDLFKYTTFVITPTGNMQLIHHNPTPNIFDIPGILSAKTTTSS